MKFHFHRREGPDFTGFVPGNDHRQFLLNLYLFFNYGRNGHKFWKIFCIPNDRNAFAVVARSTGLLHKGIGQ